MQTVLPAITLAQRIDNTDGQRLSNNIGTLRLIGALVVLFGHCWPLTSDKTALDPLSQLLVSNGIWPRPIHELGVCLFFTLSGLLITQSFDRRQSTLRYLEARLLRIFPALIVVVAVTVFVLGPIYTTLSLGDYFGHADTWKYLRNTATLQHIEYRLPAVFDALPNDSVNGSLWTLKTEFKFYLWVMAFGLLALPRKPLPFNLLAVTLIVLYVGEFAPSGFYKMLTSLNTAFLGGYFLLGALAYVNRARIILSPYVLLALIVVSALLHGSAAYALAFSVMFGYLTLLIAYHPQIRLPVADRYGDFSYGIYLYAFPVQQILVTHLHAVSAWQLLIPSLVLTSIAAACSWFLIEKPSMALKGKLRPAKWQWRMLSRKQ